VSKAPKVGSKILLENTFSAEVLEVENQFFRLRILAEKSVLELLEEFGKIPLPPYIARNPYEKDLQRYQTVFAKERGAVAAPTAGLHFDTDLLEKIARQGTAIHYLTLHVGAGTFLPVRVADINQHQMHSEWMVVDESLCEAIRACKARGGRVIAVGTTVVRALETASQSGEIKSFHGETSIFIKPGYQFQCVDTLITNFHLPKSTLLMLVSAFAGFDLIQKAYHEAVSQKYRFFSYGDAMILFRS
jgi:S-adenosylmethionine:tRNA ribosyltransferase-isomerase